MQVSSNETKDTQNHYQFEKSHLDSRWISTFEFSNIEYDNVKAAFLAGYAISRDQAVSAVCYMCARPDYYGPPTKIEGGQRLWHYQLSDEWLHGECLARPILEPNVDNS